MGTVIPVVVQNNHANHVTQDLSWYLHSATKFVQQTSLLMEPYAKLTALIPIMEIQHKVYAILAAILAKTVLALPQFAVPVPACMITCTILTVYLFSLARLTALDKHVRTVTLHVLHALDLIIMSVYPVIQI